MSRLLVAAALVALALPGAAANAGTSIEACCACLPINTPPPVPALFCAPATGEGDTVRLSDQCNAADTEARLLCVKDTGGGSCAVQLTGAEIHCPTAPAPTASPSVLVGLAAALGLLGVGLLRRRSRFSPRG